jgi:hypothetical protein
VCSAPCCDATLDCYTIIGQNCLRCKRKCWIEKCTRVLEKSGETQSGGGRSKIRFRGAVGALTDIFPKMSVAGYGIFQATDEIIMDSVR